MNTIICYHCDSLIIGGIARCRGCKLAFCKKTECSDWICSSYPICEGCDQQIRSIKRGEEICYHCDSSITGKIHRCKGCGQAFCEKIPCCDWLCFSSSVCEKCDGEIKWTKDEGI